uniref:Presenilin n=1 Tax=Schistocephalus solidus TaxID=70667 RepID=A0A183T9B1_SCHSO
LTHTSTLTLFVPVTICMFCVVVIARTVPYFSTTDVYLVYTPFHTPGADLGTQVWQTVANVLIFLGVIVVMTFLLVFLFKYKCYKVSQLPSSCHSLLTASSFSPFFYSIKAHVSVEVLRTSGIFFDNITFAILLWNFGLLGLVAIHWKSPLILQQAYLIFNSVQLALIFLKFLPKWTCWVLLGALAIWDLVAVLCPKGPLRMLVEMAHERQQPLFPAMIYSTTVAYLLADENPDAAEQQQGSTHVSSEDLVARQETGVKLGLGDFIFYSLLVGRAAVDGDVLTVVACYVAILVGMCITIVALSLVGKALPALPVSIACGILFYFTTTLIVFVLTPLSRCLVF